MSNFKIKVANFFAKNSCDKWQKIGIIRKISRKIYQRIMENKATNYPYDNQDFANWPESDKKGEYTLITDSSGFVIRRSTSFINWLVKTEVGQHLKRPVPGERLPGEHAFDAKHWDELLEYNGWERETPLSDDDCINGVHFVGIIPGEGEFGQLVWLVNYSVNFVSELASPIIVKDYEVVLYEDFQITSRHISDDTDIIWFKQPKTLHS